MSSNSLSSNPSKASGATIRAFELISVSLWVLTAVLIATVFANQRDYWFLLLSWTFVFPFSALADKYALLLRYDPRFRLMIPFAFGWFFALPLILIWQSEVLSQLGLGVQAAIVFTVLFVWSILVEYLGTMQKLWSYRWSHGWKLGAMPWAIPVIDALIYVLVFLLHGVSVQLTSGMGWASALATSYVIYAGMFVTIALFNWVMITQVFGVRPTPA